MQFVLSPPDGELDQLELPLHLVLLSRGGGLVGGLQNKHAQTQVVNSRLSDKDGRMSRAHDSEDFQSQQKSESWLRGFSHGLSVRVCVCVHSSTISSV